MKPMFVFLCLLSLLLHAPVSLGQGTEDTDRTRLVVNDDPSIKLTMKGRAGNLELKSAQSTREGIAEVDYQNGRGFVTYDREDQILTWKPSIKYTWNRWTKHIRKKAPYMRTEVPRGSEIEFLMDINSVGYGTLDFRNLNLRRFKLDVKYGDVDVSFPTENQSIVRGEAKFHVMAGDLEIYELANLKAGKVKINGGVGELSVDIGEKLLRDTMLRLDMDIGALDLTIPRGTRVQIRGTARNLSGYGFEKNGKIWETTGHSPKSPLLEIKMRGPLGDFELNWAD
ncbi:MAG: hypothetical protein QNK37_37145 [Acidobacteriota bacterium]|nr:hypothetical protein [Acidobacteriota bacterium]